MAGDEGSTGGDGPLRVASAGSLILLQLFSRFLTLFMTQTMVRLTSAEVLGVANIHFELLLGLILALSREGFRTALSRSSASPATRNVALLPVPLGMCIATVVMQVYTTYLAPAQLLQHAHFAWATRALLAGALLELLAEPLYIAALLRVDVTTRVVAEGMAVAVKGASTLAALWHLRSTSSLLPFGLGQLGYGATFLAVFWVAHMRAIGVRQASTFLVPARTASPRNRSAMFDVQSLALSATMTGQNVVKHVLGEGDKFAVARLASLREQGSYALASNYGGCGPWISALLRRSRFLSRTLPPPGSLVARLFYQPLEESSRLTFARALGDKSAPSPASIQLATDLLTHLLSFHVLLSLFLVTFCPPYSTALLLVLAGRRWATKTSAAAILSLYGAAYLPTMAFNGLLEGFLQACATPAQLTRYAYVLAAASLLFITSLFALQRYPIVSAERGLILASSMSTLARAAYSYHFTSNYLARKRSSLVISSLVPHPITLATFALSAVTVRWAPFSTEDTIAENGLPVAHLLVGFTCASLCAGSW